MTSICCVMACIIHIHINVILMGGCLTCTTFAFVPVRREFSFFINTDSIKQDHTSLVVHLGNKQNSLTVGHMPLEKVSVLTTAVFGTVGGGGGVAALTGSLGCRLPCREPVKSWLLSDLLKLCCKVSEQNITAQIELYTGGQIQFRHSNACEARPHQSFMNDNRSI